MASKRKLKKELEKRIHAVVEEAYSFTLYNPGKKDKEAEAIIDEAAELLYNVLPEVTRTARKNDAPRKALAALREETAKAMAGLEKKVSAL